MAHLFCLDSSDGYSIAEKAAVVNPTKDSRLLGAISRIYQGIEGPSSNIRLQIGPRVLSGVFHSLPTLLRCRTVVDLLKWFKEELVNRQRNVPRL